MKLPAMDRGTLTLVVAAVVAVAVAVTLGIVKLTGSGANYSAAASADCLRAAGVAVDARRADLDYIAQKAGEGAFEAHVGGNSVTVVTERSAGDAKNTEAAYALFVARAGGENSGLLARARNAVIVWDKTPRGDERATVDHCLR
jgi:hypothetical protein